MLDRTGPGSALALALVLQRAEMVDAWMNFGPGPNSGIGLTLEMLFSTYVERWKSQGKVFSFILFPIDTRGGGESASLTRFCQFGCIFFFWSLDKYMVLAFYSIFTP